jgi:AAHS family 4-hydroxybenzoate transporter-like MFS transporter
MTMTVNDAPVASPIDDAPFGPLQLRIVLLCALVAALDGFDTQAIAYVAPSIAAAWGIEKSAFGAVFGAGLLGLTIGALLLSPIGDRFGRKLVILVCTAAFGLFSLLTARATDIDQLLLYRLLTGIGLGGAMPNLIALTNEYAPARLKATLVTVMFCGFPLGSTLGGLISAPLIAAIGWPAVFIVGGTMPLLLLPVLILLLPESARFLARRGGGTAKLAALLAKLAPEASIDAFVAAARDSGGGAISARLPMLALFSHGRSGMTALIWIAFFMNLLVMYFLVNWLPSLLTEQGLPLGIAIASTAILNLGGVFGAIGLGRLIDRRNPALVLSAAYAAAALFIAVIANANGNVPLLLGGAALAGFGIVGGQIGLNAVAAAAYPTAVRATGIGWALGVGRVGSIVGPTAGGALLALGWSSRSLLLAAIVPSLIAALAVFLLRRHRLDAAD